MEVHSGRLIVNASYRARISGTGFVLEQFAISSNGLPNCQGIPADYVMSHWVKDIDVDIVDGRLRVYFPDRTYDSYTDFVRANTMVEGDPTVHAADAT